MLSCSFSLEMILWTTISATVVTVINFFWQLDNEWVEQSCILKCGHCRQIHLGVAMFGIVDGLRLWRHCIAGICCLLLAWSASYCCRHVTFGWQTDQTVYLIMKTTCLAWFHSASACAAEFSCAVACDCFSSRRCDVHSSPLLKGTPELVASARCHHRWVASRSFTQAQSAL